MIEAKQQVRYDETMINEVVRGKQTYSDAILDRWI